MLLMLGAAALGALTLTISFLVGFICLFTSKRKLEVWLTAIPAAIAALLYLCVRPENF